MDHTAAREGPSNSGVHQYLSYLAHQVGYQRLRTTFGSEISWGLYTDTSKLKWIFWKSHHSVLLIDMLLKSSKTLSTRTNGSLGLQIRNNQNLIKIFLTNSLPKSRPSHRKRRVMGRQRRTLENGVISTKALGTTPMNVSQNSHWWSKSNTRSRTLIRNLILKILLKDRSLTQTLLLLPRPQQFNQKNQQILKRGSTFFFHRCG
jgi:hypothetical protein